MIKKTILNAIRFYQRTSFFHGFLARTLFLTDKTCRFMPTCSQYTYDAVTKYGSLKGVVMGIKRILRCHPFSKGGYDPVS